jgi:hypothetical protein
MNKREHKCLHIHSCQAEILESFALDVASQHVALAERFCLQVRYLLSRLVCCGSLRSLLY